MPPPSAIYPPLGKAAEAKEKAADALSDKQRKNRRKAQN